MKQILSLSKGEHLTMSPEVPGGRAYQHLCSYHLHVHAYANTFVHTKPYGNPSCIYIHTREVYTLSFTYIETGVRYGLYQIRSHNSVPLLVDLSLSPFTGLARVILINRHQCWLLWIMCWTRYINNTYVHELPIYGHEFVSRIVKSTIIGIFNHFSFLEYSWEKKTNEP